MQRHHFKNAGLICARYGLERYGFLHRPNIVRKFSKKFKKTKTREPHCKWGISSLGLSAALGIAIFTSSGISILLLHLSIALTLTDAELLCTWLGLSRTLFRTSAD